MSGLLDLVTQQLGSGVLQQLSGALGGDQDKTQKAVGAALPVLLGALAKNASSPDGAASLANALERDHDGSILDNLGGLLGASGGLGGLLGGGDKSSSGGLGSLLGAAGSLLGGGSSAPSKSIDGAGILGHLLGSKKSAVEQGVGKASGLDAAQAGKLLVALAPILMGALGKVKKEKGLDASGLAGMLDSERQTIEQQLRQTNAGGLLGMLDSDDDGSIVDDLAKLGTGALGSLFGK
jgi:hypothetical protein